MKVLLLLRRLNLALCAGMLFLSCEVKKHHQRLITPTGSEPTNSLLIKWSIEFDVKAVRNENNASEDLNLNP